MSKIFNDCHIKTCRSLKRRAIWKIPSTAFEKSLCSFCWLENETSKKKRFPVLRQKKTNPNFAVKMHGCFFTVYLMNYIFQTSVLMMKCIVFNWLCKCMKKIRYSQPAIPVLNWVKHQSFSVSIDKKVYRMAELERSFYVYFF